MKSMIKVFVVAIVIGAITYAYLGAVDWASVVCCSFAAGVVEVMSDIFGEDEIEVEIDGEEESEEGR